MKFQILIPTYNRCADLQKNLLHLRNQLLKYDLKEDFGIAISDNASTDDTQAMLEVMKDEWNGEIEMEIICNETNAGLEQNAINLMQFGKSDYVIWLGDDDFLPDGYLHFIKDQFSNNHIGWMIPGLIGVDKEGVSHSGRPVIFPHRKFSPGYNAVYMWSHLAHQMSGLVVKRAELYELYISKPEWRNPYLFIFFMAYCQMSFEGIYAPSYQVVVNNYNPKDWGYNKIGLLDEVFKSYYYLKEKTGNRRLKKLLLRFIIMHSYRIEFDKGLFYVLKQGHWIRKSAAEVAGLKFPLFNLLLKEYLIRKFRRN